MNQKLPRSIVIAKAVGMNLEVLENRQLLAAASTLPLRLDFNGSVDGTILDKAGNGTGFTGVQANTAGDQYQSGLIDLNTASGVLKLTTRGTSTSGSATGTDNSLANGLEATFNGNTTGFMIETRLIGPLTNLANRYQQAGIYFGADQDNYVKLLPGRNYDGQYLSFEDEFTNATGGISATRNGSNAETYIGSFTSINTIDLRIVGDAATGKVSAYYRINSDSGSFTKVGYDITISADKRSTFFNAASKAGIIAIGKSDAGPITATFDSFAITAGTALLTHPSIAGVEGMNGTTTNVARDVTIVADLALSNGSSPVDVNTLTSDTVKLIRAGDGVEVETKLSIGSDGQSIIVNPVSQLDPNTTYTLQVSSGLKDQAGGTFMPYVTSFTTGSGTVINPNAAGAQASYSAQTMYFSDISSTAASGGSGTSLVQQLRITNTGTSNLVISGLNFSSGEWALGGAFTAGSTIAPGAFLDIPLVFKASAIGIRTGTVTITSNDSSTPTKPINLRGLGTAGEGGDLEPSLQRILDLYQLPINDGDSTPDTTDYPAPPTSGDALEIQKFKKAGTGPVTIEVLANFANSVSPSSRFGYYSPGELATRTQLFTVGQTSAQAVRPVTTGGLSFDPAGEFGIYGEFPAFGSRIVASEKYLNTWETNTARQQKVRFFQMKNADGSIVPNAYVFAFEEYTVTFDQNDIVGIIRNVAPVQNAPELSYVNVDSAPAGDHLVMSRIRDTQVADDPYIPNTVHDKATLHLQNTGTSNLVVTSTTLSNSDFTIVSGGGSFTLTPGATRDIIVQFVYNRTGLGSENRTATLTINSNDTDESAKVIKLSGLWQSYSENAPNGVSQEPTVAELMQSFGYDINTGTLNTHGAVSRAGEEILSEMWAAADSSRVVGVRQLVALHQQKSTTNSRIRWLLNGASGVGTTIFVHQASDGQTVLPRINGSTTAPAYGEISPGTQTFSWTVDSDQSIDSRNTNAYNPGAFPSIDGGHSLRFFAAKDSNGVLIPNTYILIMDYVGQSFSNYDYQDNIYLLTNVKPVSGALAVAGLTAATSGQGIFLDWTNSTEGNVVGYNVYRSTTSGGTYTKVNASVITGSSYTDAGAVVGTQYFYQVKPVDQHGTVGAAASISFTRQTDTVAPVTPTFPTANGTTGGISLQWTANSEADLAGYNVYRSTTANGVFTKLNTSPISVNNYLDTSAPSGATSYYRITAIDLSGNESPAATANAYRPVAGNVPNAPTSLIATATTTNSITLSWTDNATDETGFIIEKQNTDGTYSQFGTTSANVTTLAATGLQGGTSYVFRVRATNASGSSAYSNVLTAATQQSAPIAATNLLATVLNSNSVKLTWTDNATNETSYRIERRIGTGSWVVLDTVATNITLYVDQSAAASTNYGYQVIAVNSAGDSPASNTAAASTPAADGYQSADIGSPSMAGSTSVVSAGKDYDITAGGSDIWGTADQFRYVYKSVTGDFDYSAQITGVSIGDIGSMAGLMARESLAANSRHIYMRAIASNTERANYRLTTGGTSVGVSGTQTTSFPNAYVRLQRVGNVFNAYGSPDGQNWTLVTSQTMAMPTTIFFGMAVSARSSTATTVGKVRGLTDRLATAGPNGPTNLIGSANTATPSVSLAWTDNATNETGYRVERRIAGSSSWTTVATLGANTTSYLDNTVQINTQYVYRVFATTAALDSAPSAELTVNVANGVPIAPTNLVATNTAGGAKLVWSDNSSNESDFQIERKTSSGTWASIGIVDANVTTYTDATLSTGVTYVYRVRALGEAADSGYSNEATLAAPATLAFTSVDIGGASGGSTQVVNTGTDYNVIASGTDIWNGSDQFRFAYRQVSGDFDIQVRVAGINFTSDQSMAGLMARASLDANSRNVYIKARADGTDRMTYRSSTGAATTGVGAGTSTFPNGYLRLTRVGNTFTGYGSADGVTWTVISTVTMSLPTMLYVGMAAASHVTGVTTTAQFRDLTLA